MELIYFPKNFLRPNGGPSGYLYNLKAGLDALGYDIDFLPEANLLVDNAKLRKFVPKRLKELRRLKYWLNIPNASIEPPVDLSRYDLVHFHQTLDMYLCRKALTDYKGKVLLTSHSPSAPHVEATMTLNSKDAKKYSTELGKLEIVDEYAFSRADYVVFPCEEAEEPYFNTWPKYNEVRKLSKRLYLPTGVNRCVPKCSKFEVRKRYGIPENAFVVCYVGRHNEVKGYSDLKDMARDIFQDENTWILVAGKEEPLTRFNHPRWVEVGWTSDPYSIIAASDVYILPNRETFFDLVMLEVLSLGKVIIASNTGGNKYFKRFESGGIVLANDSSDMINEISHLRSEGGKAIDQKGLENLRLYEAEFTCKKFGKKYIEILESVI